MTFRFPFQQLNGLLDAQRNFEVLEPVISDAVDPTQFLQLFTAGTHKCSFGSANMTYPGLSSFSNNAIITPGLGGVTPVCILITNNSGPIHSMSITAVSPVAFSVQAYDTTGAMPAGGSAVGFYWLAIT